LHDQLSHGMRSDVMVSLVNARPADYGPRPRGSGQPFDNQLIVHAVVLLLGNWLGACIWRDDADEIFASE